MPRKLRFDVRKGSSQKAKQKSEFTTTDLKECCYERPSTTNVEIQTDIQYHCDSVDSSVQALVELATATIGTQTDSSQAQPNETVDCASQTDDTTGHVNTVDVQGRNS